MAAQRVSEGEDPRPLVKRRPPASTPEARENQLISLSYDLAEKQLRDGSASAQVITNFLKLGSSREKLEQEKIRMENELLEARKEQLESQARVEELYIHAIEAMRSYSGSSEPRLPDTFDD